MNTLYCAHHFIFAVEDSKVFLVKPMKAVIADVTVANQNITKFKKKFPSSTSLAPGLEQHLADATSNMNVSAFLFEKHRVASLRTLLVNLLHTEMKFHLSAIENISPVLEALYRIPDPEKIYEDELTDPEDIAADR